MTVQNLKGTKDYLPEEEILRQRIVNTLKRIFELYGYNPLETSVIESYDVLTEKYEGTEDILKEIYKFEDQGKRKLALRTELTPPFARVMAENPQLRMPFKRYEIGKVFRDGPIKAGRLREFTQCDVDVAGTESMAADAELLSLVDRAFKELKLDVRIVINNRKISNALMEYCGVEKEKISDALISIDKLAKIGVSGVENELREKKIKENVIEKITETLSIQGNNEEVLKQVKRVVKSDEGKEGIKEIEEILDYCKSFGLKNVDFDSSMVRGLSYYTGPVFEAYLKESGITSSVVGGGRYDKMIGALMNSKEKIPAVGLSFGLVPIFEAMKSKIKGKTVVQCFVIPIGETFKEAFKIVEEIREKGVNCEIDLMKRKVGKALEYVNKEEIPFALFVGENELKEKKVKLRDMKTGEEKLLSLESVVKQIKG